MSGSPLKLRDVHYREAVKAFQRLGFHIARQKGSHIVMSKPGVPFNVVIPAHGVVKPGTLRQCLRAGEVTPEQFAEAL